MSDETARALQNALQATEQARREADLHKQACLDDVAENLPAKVDAVAKRWAHAEPEVTKGLGKEGIQELRAKLRAEAASLAADIKGGAGEIEWPEWETYFPIQERKIHSALFKFLYGSRANRITGVFKAHGYASREGGRSQSTVLPQELYEEQRFEGLAAALNALGEAEQTLASAKAKDDKASVEDLWQE